MSSTEDLLADFLTQREAAAELKVCERTLDRWRARGIIRPKIREILPVPRICGKRMSCRQQLNVRRQVITKDQLTDFLVQEEAAAEIKCPPECWRARGIIRPKIREILPSD